MTAPSDGLPEPQFIRNKRAAITQRAFTGDGNPGTEAYELIAYIDALQSALAAALEERKKDADYINRLSIDLVSAGNEIAAALEREKAGEAAKQLLLNLCCACVGKLPPRSEPFVDARKFLGLE